MIWRSYLVLLFTISTFTIIMGNTRMKTYAVRQMLNRRLRRVLFATFMILNLLFLLWWMVWYVIVP